MNARNQLRQIVVVSACLLLGCGNPDSSVPSKTESGNTAKPEQKTNSSAESDPDQKLREQIVGTWRDHYQGTRTMEVRADGTCKMTIELTGWRAAMFVAKSHYNIKWKIEDGVLTTTKIDGEPADKVKWVIRVYGATATERIKELTEARLVTVDVKSGDQFNWERLSE